LCRVSACETDRGFSGTEDFWIVLTVTSEDETEIRAGESTGRTGREGYPAGYARHFSAEEKIRIVLEGLRAEESIAGGAFR
jgi:hypothetical protein